MFYAKSEPVESIKEHTDKLLKNLELLKNTYGKQIVKNISIDESRFWYLMRIVCKYHDAGKAFSGFQNMIRTRLKLELIKTRFNYDEIKHEQISPAFIPFQKLDLSKDERKLIYQAIYYHHERDSININKELLKEIIEEDIKPNLNNIIKELNIEVEELNTKYIGMVESVNRICEGDRLYYDYCIIKGLLHRLDHCSSADIKVENDTTDNISEYVQQFMENKKFNLNDLQEYSKKNQENNLIVIGSTGMGKTESALLWSNSNKTFFTLPLRISINAIYERIKQEINYKSIGLLHSTAIDYLEKKDNDIYNELQKIDQSRNLYEKITTCTIDQIFPFVFKYRGYEKIYSTLSYSKVIIDEIQAYSPEIVAIILKGLKMINNIGGKFMIMTATLPRIYKEELEKFNIPFKYDEFTKKSKRHKIKIQNNKIEDDINIIIEKSKYSKVLIITNTINKAIELYSKFQELSVDNINLLHSRFIFRDRNEKEEYIKEFSKNRDLKGIWITTQIVEASLDIDFDYLFTEMSTLDSLFQRLGRCYRSRSYEIEECNVMIYTKEISGVKYVYDKDVYEKSIELLEKYDNEILEEDVKIKLVDKLYSREMLENTEFYKNFKESMEILDNIVDYNTSKKEAQKLLRKIDNISVVPKIIYDDNIKLFESFENEKNLHKKNQFKRKINQLLTSISKNNFRRLKEYISECPYCKDIYIIDLKYNNEIGLLLEKDEEYEIDSRIF